jgi:hypothetical protein
VVSFNSHIGIDVSNFGDGEVYLSYVTCSSENPKFTVGWSINTIAKAKSFTFKKFDRPEEKLAWGTGPLSESKWQEVLKLGRDACFDWNILDRNNPVYHDFKNFCGNDFRSIPLVANLILNSGSDGRRLIQDIPVYAVPVFKNTKECRTKLGLHD